MKLEMNFVGIFRYWLWPADDSKKAARPNQDRREIKAASFPSPVNLIKYVRMYKV